MGAQILQFPGVPTHAEEPPDPPDPAQGAVVVRIDPPPDEDAQLIKLWLHGRSPNTIRGYSADLERFRCFTGRKPFGTVNLADLQDFNDSIAHLKPRTQCRMLAAVKSLLAFGHRIGVLRFDVGRALRLPKVPNDLAARILDEESVLRMIALEEHKRNGAMIRLLYIAGLRVSELCGLHWRDLQPRGEAGQCVVTGKGSKTRSVLLTAACWRVLVQLRSDASADAPVFKTKKGGGICPSWVARLVRKAARRAGIDLMVSTHWMRHAMLRTRWIAGRPCI